jgi:uncharacterized damage-inducible protein DinB
MSSDFFNIAGIFKTNTELFKKTINPVPPERWFASPGNDSNHLMWIAGHVVVHRAKVLRILGQQWSAPWEGLFARGTQAAAPEQYPQAAEIVQAWDEVSGKLASSLAGTAEETLAQPVSKGITLDGKVSGQIAFLSFHESYHVGQMAYLRKWLGHGQTVG